MSLYGRDVLSGARVCIGFGDKYFIEAWTAFHFNVNS